MMLLNVMTLTPLLIAHLRAALPLTTILPALIIIGLATTSFAGQVPLYVCSWKVTNESPQLHGYQW